MCTGSKELNPCGKCLDPNDSEFEDECMGICEGNLIEDACGICLLVSDPTFNECMGCDGVAFSNKTVDCNGECGGACLHFTSKEETLVVFQEIES